MRSFSNTFESTGSRLMGLQDCAFSGGFLGFRIGIMWRTFHSPGKCPVRRMLLNSWMIARIPTSGSSFKTLPLMRSYPGDLVDRSLCMAVRISVTLNG